MTSGLTSPQNSLPTEGWEGCGAQTAEISVVGGFVIKKPGA